MSGGQGQLWRPESQSTAQIQQDKACHVRTPGVACFLSNRDNGLFSTSAKLLTEGPISPSCESN